MYTQQRSPALAQSEFKTGQANSYLVRSELYFSFIPKMHSSCINTIKTFSDLNEFSFPRLQEAIDYLSNQISSTRNWMEREHQRFEKEFVEKIDQLSMAIKEKSVCFAFSHCCPTILCISRLYLFHEPVDLGFSLGKGM